MNNKTQGSYRALGLAFAAEDHDIPRRVGHLLSLLSTQSEIVFSIQLCKTAMAYLADLPYPAQNQAPQDS